LAALEGNDWNIDIKFEAIGTKNGIRVHNADPELLLLKGDLEFQSTGHSTTIKNTKEPKASDGHKFAPPRRSNSSYFKYMERTSRVIGEGVVNEL